MTFNPDFGQLRDNVEAVLKEVDEILILDNASHNSELVKNLTHEFPGANFHRKNSNGGMAKALNQIMKWASDLTATWAPLLDQDSEIGVNMVTTQVVHAEPGIWIVAPSMIDRSAVGAVPAAGPTTDVNYCISSRSLCSIQAWESVDGYDEANFIDFVVCDFCLRQSGFRIVRESRSTLLHEIGKITRHGPFTEYHHSAFRSYHMARDMLYYAKKHSRSPRELMVQQRGLLGTYAVLARKAIIVALFEEDRLQRVTSILRGIVSGTFAVRRVA